MRNQKAEQPISYIIQSSMQRNKISGLADSSLTVAPPVGETGGGQEGWACFTPMAACLSGLLLQLHLHPLRGDGSEQGLVL